MSLITEAVETSDTAATDVDLSGDWSDFGCEVNTITPAELFACYEKTRFLYPAKRARLQPYWPVVLDNWERARRAGELLSWVATYRDAVGGWASVSSWRTTHGGWQSQHLVSTGTLVGGRAVLLAGQATLLRDRLQVSQQNWFSPDNRFSAQAFGGMTLRLGPGSSVVVASEYVMMPLTRLPEDAGTGVEELDGGRCVEVAELARHTRGEIYVRAEGLDRDDLGLDEVDRLYRLVGLRRYRRIWVRRDPAGRVHAAAVAYRGPLGMNFSFLENRCDLLIDPDLDAQTARQAAIDVLAAAADAYRDFELAAMPVVAAAAIADRLVTVGAEHIRSYSQAIWLAEAYPAWYRHIDDLYERRLRGRAPHPRRTV